MIALDPYYCADEGRYAVATLSDLHISLVFCSLCGRDADCGTGHQRPYFTREGRYARQYIYVAGNASKPTEVEHRFRAHAIGRRYIPVALDLAALPLVDVEMHWARPFTPMRPVRVRRAARARSIAPLRSRPGRRRRLARR